MKKMKNLKSSKLKNLVSGRSGIFALVLSFALLLTTVTFAWYQNQVSLEGNTFKTGDIDFISRGYDKDGNLMTTILQDGKDASAYEKVNYPLFNHTGWDANMEPETSYIVIEKTGSLEMDYKISFTTAGTYEYLGGFWYALTDVTNEVTGGNASAGADQATLLKSYIAKGNSPKSETAGYNMATMDRYATIGSILDNAEHTSRYYRLDYGMKASAIPTEYTNLSIEVFAKIFVTQVGALDSEDGTGYTYNCTSQLDIEKAREQALPGDNIVLLNNITFEGDLVFNKGVNIFTNNYTLEVLGNLIYEYVAATDLTVNVSGNGRILVHCPRAGVGGNFTIEAPNSNVTVIGSNTSVGDIVTENRFTVSGTRAYGAAGVTLRNLRVIDKAYGTLKTIYIGSNTRITVTDNTTVSRLEAAARTTNIEVQNMGTVHELSLTNMNILPQTLSPQIYIYNMGIIMQTIQLPAWSTPFKIVNSSPLACSGNTKIVQAIIGNDMSVTGATVSGAFITADIEKESIDETVVPMGDSNTQLIVYYQNIKKDGELVETTIQSLLEDYFREKNVVNIAASIAEITDLRIVSVEGKQVLNSDIQYLRGTALPYLKNLDLERAILFDTNTSRENCLYDQAFYGDTRLESLVLPQRLESIGTGALQGMSCDDIIRIPESVTEFGTNWFRATKYVCFESPAPVLAAYNAPTGLYGIKAIFVEEPYISAYRENFTSYANIIYCVAQKDDSGNNFVRKISQGNDWELVYYAGTQANVESLSIGENIRVAGQLVTIANIGENAYRNTLPDTVVTIRFADGVKVIGKNAFYGRPIKTVESWGNSLTTIGYGAFENCSLLQGEIILPATMQTIDSYAFASCGAIESINTGGTKKIHTGAFRFCSSLIYADMPNVTVFETTGRNGVFYECSQLVSIKAPSLVRTVGSVFWNLSALRELVFGATSFEEVESSGYYAFYNSVNSNTKIYFDADDVSSMSINGVSSEYIYASGEKMDELFVNGYNIGKYIVRNNDNREVVLSASNVDYVSSTSDVETITLPNEFNGSVITEIGRNAFRQQNFDNVILKFGNNLKIIGGYAFYQKDGICGLDFSNSEKLEVIEKYAFYNCKNIIGSLVLPDSMRKIYSYAFSECVGITSLYAGGTEFLDNYSFGSCTGLVTADIANVTILGSDDSSDGVFKYCSNLVFVNMPSVYLAECRYLFGYCPLLREIYMASNNEAIAFRTNAFFGCTSNKIKIFVPTDLVDFYKTKSLGLDSKYIYENGTKMDVNLVNGYNIGKYIVKVNDDDTATLITTCLEYTGDFSIPEVWNDNGILRDITIIGKNAFEATVFTDVVVSFGNVLVKIEDRAFYGNTGLIGVASWGTSLESVGKYAFANCTELKDNVKLPDSMVCIDDYAFYKSGILSVNTGMTSSIGISTFESCTNLLWAELPNIEVIGRDGYSSNSLFSRASNLVSVKMPKLETVIGEFMFGTCTSLKEIYFASPNFTSMVARSFYQCTTSNIKLFVPAELYAFYVSKNPGSIGVSRIFPQGEKVGTNSVNGFNIGEYIVMTNADGQSATLVTSNNTFTGDVTLPDTFDNNGSSVPITSIFKNAFVNQSFTDVNLAVGAYVKEIGESAFEGRTGILSVNLKNTETVLGAAFRNCSDMNNLVANYLKTVSGDNAFNGCKSLTILTLPKLETISGSQNFANNTSLKKVYLQNIVSFGNGDFYYCSGLEEFVINKKITASSELPVTAYNVFSSEVSADLPIRVPAASMSYYNGSWQGRPVLAYGETVTVGNDSFVVLPMNGGYVIQSYIGGAESVILPDTLDSLNVVGLEENAFEIVTQTITSVTLPEYLYFLGSGALSELPYLEEITVNENNRFFTSADGVLYSKDGMMLVKYPCGKAVASFNVSDTVAAIGANAFKNALNLQTVVFGSGLGVIDSTSFIGCKNLKQVTFTGTVPPILMGSSIFDTNVTDFAMTVPAGSIETYIRAFNFAEYASFINGGTEIPESGMMNIVNWQPAIIQETNTYALSPKEDNEDDDDGDDGDKEPETDI